MMTAARLRMDPTDAERFDNVMETPTMNRKNGKIRSVGVHPCHGACSSGAYTVSQSPGLLTTTMAAIVMPRNTSSDTSRLPACMSGILTPAGYTRRVLDPDRPQAGRRKKDVIVRWR